ncbi:MAG: hypothetical protein LBT21_01785 [Oscillospiraceae bacterium]|jgi:hypothetical protein|nr:hypothetical protein [Oscillospiraceae bacterium]
MKTKSITKTSVLIMVILVAISAFASIALAVASGSPADEPNAASDIAEGPNGASPETDNIPVEVQFAQLLQAAESTEEKLGLLNKALMVEGLDIYALADDSITDAQLQSVIDGSFNAAWQAGLALEHPATIVSNDTD